LNSSPFYVPPTRLHPAAFSAPPIILNIETDSAMSLYPSILNSAAAEKADSTSFPLPLTTGSVPTLSVPSFPSSLPSPKYFTEPKTNDAPFNLPIPPTLKIFANDEKVRATPFLIEYTVGTQLRSLQQLHINVLDVTAQLTMKHLETFLSDQFNSIFGATLMLFGSTHMDRGSDESSLAIAYGVDMVFDGRYSAFIPTPEDVDLLTELAFTEPAVLSLIHDLRDLPQEIPFRETVSILYVAIHGLSMEDRGGPVAKEESGNVLLSPASFGVLVGGSILILLLVSYSLWIRQVRTRCVCVKKSADSLLLNNIKATERKNTMPFHSFAENFLTPQHYSDVRGNSLVIGNTRAGSPTVSSSTVLIRGRAFGQMSVASMASETLKMNANLPYHDCEGSDLSVPWYDAPLTSRGHSSSSLSPFAALTAAEQSPWPMETNFDPPSLPRFPVDPPASQEQRQHYSSKLNIRIV
jgi:hypothetical protein